MVGLLLASSLLSAPKTPQEVILALETRYEKAKAFSAHLVHHNSSGLFPGDYEQDLTFTSPKIFTLLVTKSASGVERTVGNFNCDGTTVQSTGGNPARGDQALEHDANVEPGYEVSGGMILSWLLNSPSGKFILTPPKGMTINYAWGKPVTWHGVKTAAIELKIEFPGNGHQAVTLHLTEKLDELVGYEAESDHGYLIYQNQKLTDGQ